MTLDQDVQKEMQKGRFNSYAMGFFGGLITGGVVAWVNRRHGTDAMMWSGVKQAAYTFTVGSTGVYTCRRFLKRSTQFVRKTLEATIVPSIFTFTANYAYHSLLQTPEAFYSAVATFSMAVATFLPYAVYSQYRPQSRI